jgi:large subunit ribosomal protein L15
MKISDLKPAKGSRPKRFKVGRGEGSGLGKTSGRGGKGQTARKSGPVRAGFEGGQNPIHRRVPKVGFNSHFPERAQVVNLGDIEARIKGPAVTINELIASGLVKRKNHPVKILAKGKLTKAFNIKANKFSATALEAIKAAGGTAEVVDPRTGGTAEVG